MNGEVVDRVFLRRSHPGVGLVRYAEIAKPRFRSMPTVRVGPDACSRTSWRRSAAGPAGRRTLLARRSLPIIRRCAISRRPLGQFDVVFCRNVLIYFDQPTKAKVLDAIAQQMPADGIFYWGITSGHWDVSTRCPLYPLTSQYPDRSSWSLACLAPPCLVTMSALPPKADTGTQPRKCPRVSSTVRFLLVIRTIRQGTGTNTWANPA